MRKVLHRKNLDGMRQCRRRKEQKEEIENLKSQLKEEEDIATVAYIQGANHGSVMYRNARDEWKKKAEELAYRAQKIHQLKALSHIMFVGDRIYGPSDTHVLTRGNILNGMRHNGTANYLMGDFHVENRAYNAVPATSDTDANGIAFGRIYTATTDYSGASQSAFWGRTDYMKYWPGPFSHP